MYWTWIQHNSTLFILFILFIEQDDEIAKETNQRLPEFVNFLANRGLKMFHQNIRGLDLHKTELDEPLGSFRGIDLLVLLETHLLYPV